MIDQDWLSENEDHEDQIALGRLIELGRKKSFVTFDDILKFYPQADQDMDHLEQAFVALLSAGIPFVDETPTEEGESTQSDAGEVADPNSTRSIENDEDYLENIDIDDGIGLYLKEVGRIPLLTAQQEVELAQRIERGRLAREELAKSDVNPLRTRELHHMVEDGWLAREHLLTANSRLVISVAKKYMRRGVPFMDLIQEGNIGLIRAAKKFEYRRGFKFSTYATWWIRQAVTRAISDQGRTIRVPVHMGDQINRLLRMQHKLTQQFGRDPSLEEMAEALEITPEKVENLIKITRLPLSLETPTDAEEDSVLGDFIPDEESIPPEESATHNLLREHLERVFKNVPPREVRILQLRYGLLDGQAYTLEEVGRKMGVTRERVRQIEAQALSRLRNPAVRELLRDYLL